MGVRTRLANVFRVRTLEREFDDEIRFHLEQRAEQNVKLGMSPAEAEQDAFKRFGSVEQAKGGMRAARVPSIHTAAVLMLGLAVMVFSGWMVMGRRPSPIYELTDGISAPIPLVMAKAAYTPLAKQAKVHGAVRVRCVVRPSGRCSDVVVVRSLDTHFGLDAEAVRAVRESRFQPGTRDGNLVSTRVDMEVRFALR